MPQKKYLKKTPKRPRKRVAKKQSIVNLVKSIVNRNEETKMATNSYTLTNFNSAINGSGDYITVLPQVALGTAQNQRIGGAIKPVKLVIRGYVTYNADSFQGARMIGTRMFCFSDKTCASYPVMTSAGNNYQLLDTGGSPAQFTGTAMNFITPHNTDAFKWYADKKHVIQKPFGYTNTLSPSSTNEITGMDKSMFKPFTITIPAGKLPANLKFDESVSSTYPVNFAPFFAIGYCDLLGYPADTVVTQLKMEFSATLYYKDA